MGAALALLGLALLSSAPATGALLVVWGCVILSGFAYMLWLRVQAGRLARMLEDQDLPAYKQAWQEALEHGEEVRRREGAVDPTASAEMERRQSGALHVAGKGMRGVAGWMGVGQMWCGGVRVARFLRCFRRVPPRVL
eukprot:348657-Rhodomonas_salina.1